MTLSLIVVSRDDARFGRFLFWLGRDDVDVVRVRDASSMSEGLNRGVDAARGDVLAFCHDDVEILSSNFLERVEDSLRDHDVIGLAGSDQIFDGTWSTSGPEHTVGQCSGCEFENPDGPYQVSIFGDRFGDVSGIQALDGCFMAAKRSAFDVVKFDEEFDGWHFYDMDFAFSAHAAGLDVAVVTDVAFIHHSNATFTGEWLRYRDVFEQKHADRLPSPVVRGETAHRVVLRARTKDLVTEIMEGKTAFSREVRDQARETFSVLRGAVTA